MTPALTSLDAFLESPQSQRDVTRVVRALVHRARSLVLVSGEGAAPLVCALAQVFAGGTAHALLIEAEPTRITPLRRGGQALTLADRSPADALRAVLRQDPDVVAITSIDDAAAPIAVQAMLTGHLLIAGVAAGPGDDALGALCVGSEGLRPHLEQSIDVAVELEGAFIRTVRWKGTPVVRAVGGQCEVDRAALPPLPERAVLHHAQLAPPLSARAAPSTQARAAFVPLTRPGAAVRSAIATADALRPEGSAWPRCGACAHPLAHVVTLDRAELPPPFSGAGLVQLFVCEHGCDTRDERAPGVLLEAFDSAPLARLEHPARRVGVEPGGIIDWVRVDEDPTSSQASAPPLPCDKLGGWPALAQGDDWPTDADGAPFELLFQFVEGAPLDGGRSEGWDFERAELVSAEPARRVLDPNLPRHVAGVLTGDAVGLVFQSASGLLAFRWQAG